MKTNKGIGKRNIIQLVFALLTNGYILGFLQGKIYKGKLKLFCVPGLNCYSCPGAVGSCPIGAFQAVISSGGKSFSYYVSGIIILFGVLLGRLVCGFLCPFGFIQDLIYKIKAKKLVINKKIDKPLRYLKYIILIVFVFLMPLLLKDKFGISSPYFCKLICPAGTLEGAVPLMIKNEGLRQLAGFLFNWKMLILIIVIILSVFVYRPFCKYLCPLGAMYGMFNKVSFYKMHVDDSKCTNCKACEKACKMNVEVLKNINSPECIRCGECKSMCPANAIDSMIITRK